MLMMLGYVGHRFINLVGKLHANADVHKHWQAALTLSSGLSFGDTAEVCCIT